MDEIMLFKADGLTERRGFDTHSAAECFLIIAQCGCMHVVPLRCPFPALEVAHFSPLRDFVICRGIGQSLNMSLGQTEPVIDKVPAVTEA